MPEAGLIPIPRKIASQGVTDMLRISDGRMSGTAGGTIILHVSPEAAQEHSVLGIVRNGDQITCNVEQRLLHLQVDDLEIQRRIGERKGQAPAEVDSASDHNVLVARTTRRGYRGLYERCVNQAHLGADFDFLTATGPGERLND